AHLARGGLVDAGDHVEAGRLAGAVRADEPDDLALAHLQLDVVDGAQAAEADAELIGDEQLRRLRGLVRHDSAPPTDVSVGRSRPSGRQRRRNSGMSQSSFEPMMPCGRHSTITSRMAAKISIW